MALGGDPGDVASAPRPVMNGSRHRWQASRSSSWHGQSRTTSTPGAASPELLRVGELGEVAGAAGHDVVQQQRVARSSGRRRVRVDDCSTARWSGAPPMCSRSPSWTAADQARHGEAVAERDHGGSCRTTPRSRGCATARACGCSPSARCGSGHQGRCSGACSRRCRCRACRSPRRPGTAARRTRCPPTSRGSARARRRGRG